MVLNCVFVGLGGAAGSVARYLLGLIPLPGGGGFPFATLGINVLGAFCIGVLAALAGRYTAMDPRLLLFLKVGLCGGFTTFSTFCGETAELLRSGRVWLAVLYAAASVLLGVAAVFAGRNVVR